MKSKVITSFMIGTAALLASKSMFANHVQIVNHSKDIKEMTVEYQVAYANDKGAVFLTHPQKVEVINFVDIPINDLKGYRYSGIIPIAVDTHRNLENAGNFGKPRQCTLATDNEHPEGVLTLTYSGPSNTEGQLSCRTLGGTFIPNHL